MITLKHIIAEGEATIATVVCHSVCVQWLWWGTCGYIQLARLAVSK